MGTIALDAVPEKRGVSLDVFNRHIVLPIQKVKLGLVPRTFEEFLKILNRRKFDLSEHAGKILSSNSFRIAQRAFKVAVTSITVADLGFPKGSFYSMICKRGQARGYGLCLPEVAPQICLQCDEDIENTTFWLAMKPIIDEEGVPNTFSLGNDGCRCWLGTGYAEEDRFYPADEQFVFSQSLLD